MICPRDFPVEHLIAYIEDTLPQDMRRTVEQHLRTCAICRQRLDACLEMNRIVRGTQWSGHDDTLRATMDEWLRGEAKQRARRIARQRRLRTLIPIAVPLKCLLLAIALRPQYGTTVRLSASAAAAIITAVVLRQALAKA